MKVLIVGGGLVGSQIARILVERGERPVVMDRAPQPDSLAGILDLSKIDLVPGDVLSPFAVSSVIRDHGIDTIAHTAANPMLTAGAQKEPYAAIHLNIMGTVNVLEAARIHGVKRVVVSSSSVLNTHFGGGEGGGDMTREEALPRPTTFYAATKQAVESIGLNYAKHCGIEFAGMRYGPVAGPWRGPGGGEPTNIFRRIVTAAMKGEEAVIPAASLEWVYSKDAAAATVAALTAASLGGRIFNVTMGRIVAPQDFADTLKSVMPAAKVRVEPPKGGAAPAKGKAASIAHAKEVLGYTPKYDLPEAIRDYSAWLREHADS
jgi:nucleoside-diphosphate-sugar epimerase